jgi:tripartite ATP-independent transporter DctM subunit
MNEITVGLLGIALVLILFGFGIEIGFAMAIVGFVGFAYLQSFDSALIILGRDFFDVLSSYGYTVFPLFILMGQIAFNAGIAGRLYDASHKFLGHIPGGLAMATVAAATAFKAICGSSTATAATFSSVAVPEMEKYGYDKRLSTGVVATVGTLGVILPPSVTLILYGVITEQSVGKLFIAGLIPGLMIASLYILVIYVWAKLNPAVAPRSEKSAWIDRVKTLPEVAWIIVIFLLVVGGIMKGFFTPTEAGSVGVVGVLFLALAKKARSFKMYTKSLRETLRTACMIFMLLAGSFILGHFIAITNIPQVTAEWVTSLNVNRYLIMAMIIIIYQIGGSFIEDLAFMILATPIFYPTMVKLGFDPLWIGIIIGVTVMIGVVLPPMAIVVFVVKNITGVPLNVIYKGVYPFLTVMVLAMILLFIFPGLALWLPSILFK